MGLLKPKPGVSGEFGRAVACASCGASAYENATCPSCGQDPMRGSFSPVAGAARSAPAARQPAGPAAPFEVEIRGATGNVPRSRAAAPPAFQAPPAAAPYAPPPAAVPSGYLPASLPGEQFVGEIPKLKTGMSDYDLVFTTHRILVVKRGSSGWADHLGGAVVGTVVRSGQQSATNKFAGLSFGQVLSSNASNFEIPYGAVQKAVLAGGISAVTTPSLTIWIPGKAWKFSFMGSLWMKDRSELVTAARLVSNTFGARATVKGV